ncbi:MAG: DUF4089 domain-containing protein [Nostocales cyanobacterium]|nr:MAG: DUF4089 domain-containing protein [Nostocales cyanobacterium]
MKTENNLNHNEFNVREYVKQMSSLLELPINDEYEEEVIANFERIRSIAELVNKFSIPEEIEIAPIFEP